MAPRNSTIQQQWAPASKKDPVKKVRLDLSGKIRNSAEERQLKTRQQDKKQSYKKEPLWMPNQSKKTDEGATVGAWVVLEAGEHGGVRRSGRAPTPNVRNAELSA